MFLKGRFDEVTRLISPKLYYTPLRGQSPVKPILPTIEETLSTSKRPEFLAQSSSLVLVEEHFVEELDRRVLQELNYDPASWLEARKMKENGQFREVEAKRQAFLRNLNWTDLLEYITKWDTHVVKDNKTLFNLVNSYLQYKVHKIGTEQVQDLEAVLSSSTMIGFSVEKDNTYCTLLVSPKPEKIRLNQDGKLILQGSSRMITAPLIIVSEEGVEEVTSLQLKGSTLPPYLVAFLHELHHFFVYALQRYPVNVTASLLFSEGMRQD